jgi:hypothetical protein
MWLGVYDGSRNVLNRRFSNGFIPEKWLHLCLVFSPATITLYLNGVGSAYKATKPSLTLKENAMAKSQWSDGDALFIGRLADFRIFAKSLSSSEAKSVYGYKADGLTADIFIPSCSAGQYPDPDSGGVACMNCDAGKYGWAGASACAACPQHSSSSPGSSQCTARAVCSAGQYLDQPSDACKPCPAGNYSAAGASACVACPPGSSSAEGAGSCEARPGYYDLGGVLKGYYPFDPAAPWSDSAGGLGPLVPPSPPPEILPAAGPFAGAACAQLDASGEGGCVAAPRVELAGRAFAACLWFRPGEGGVGPERERLLVLGGDAQSGLAVAASVGAGGDLLAEVSAGGSARGDVRLAGGPTAGGWAHACVEVADGARVALHAAAGSNSTPLSAPAAAPLVLDGNCLGGPGAAGGPGAFRGRVAEARVYGRALSAAERAAVRAQGGPGNASSTFVPCPAGTYVTGIGARDSAACAACAAGRFLSAAGATASEDCAPCPAGSSAGARQSACRLCTAGRYQTGAEASVCAVCAAGTYQTGIGMAAAADCALCAAGTYQNRTGAAVQAACILCVAGTYQTGSGMAAAADCVLCAAGTYQNRTGAAEQAACLLCQAGTYQTGSGMAAAADCALCAAGTYQNRTGAAEQAACLLCQAGTYQTGSGMQAADSCALCGVGTSSTGIGADTALVCLACGPGKYQTGLGLADCVLCGAGTFQTAVGATAAGACAPCAAGTYSEAAGADRCAACPANSRAPGASAAAADCACLRGFRRLPPPAPPAACADVDECAEARTAGACGAQARCVNTAGSFRCDPLPPGPAAPPACPDPYPPTCRSAGGTEVWIFVGPGAAAGAARTRFVLGGRNASTPAAPAGGAWVRAACPPSGGSAGRADGAVERADGATACTFALTYAPGPAAVAPRAVPLAGGPVRVDLTGFGDPAAAAGPCAVLFGAIRGARFPLGGAAPAAVDLVAPPQAAPGPAPLRLECDSDGPAGPVGLGAALEYRRGPALDFAAGAPRCARGRACALAVAVLDPPDAAVYGLRVRVRRADRAAAGGDGGLMATVQVRWASMYGCEWERVGSALANRTPPQPPICSAPVHAFFLRQCVSFSHASPSPRAPGHLRAPSPCSRRPPAARRAPPTFRRDRRRDAGGGGGAGGGDGGGAARRGRGIPSGGARERTGGRGGVDRAGGAGRGGPAVPLAPPRVQRLRG